MIQNIDGKPMKLLIDPKANMFKWGPMPLRYFYQGDFNELMYNGFYQKYYAGYEWSPSYALYLDSRILWLSDHNELLAVAKKVVNDIILPSEKLQHTIKDWKSGVKSLNSVRKQVMRTNLAKLSDTEFLKLWAKIHEQILLAFAHGLIPEIVSCSYDKCIDDELKRYVSSDSERMHVMEVLTAPEKMSFNQKEECDLSKVKTDEQLAKHHQKYAWISNSYAKVEDQPISFFVERQLKLPAHLEAGLKESFAKRLKLKKEISKQYKLPAQLVKRARIIAMCGMWQDDRKKEIVRVLAAKHKVIVDAARRLNANFDDLLNFGSGEIAQMFVNKPTAQILASRRKAFGQLLTPDIKDFRWFNEREAIELWNIYTHVDVHETQTHAKGTLASKGNGAKLVRGVARIVLDIHKKHVFNDGDILVATFTEPEYITLMKRSAAIVTDEGSLTSHAAITSRELGKLCIVGTKIATRLFKDGDLIEVDSNTGVVTKIK